jgi:GNAT superfamily N-acetyltransferase
VSIEVRQFRRTDRDQLTDLVNAHAAAVVPGVSASVNTVLSQLEREPGEFIVDPWVSERVTLVAEQRQRIVAAAHLLRYAADDRVSESYRDSGEIRWFLYWPEAPYWRDAPEAGDVLAAACVAQLDRWGVARQYADGTLPVLGVYGVPEQWPHIRTTYERAGFVHGGRTEIVLVTEIERLPRLVDPPIADLILQRSVGINGTRLAAVLGADEIGFVEVDTNLEDAVRLSRRGGWADIGNLQVAAEHRRRGVGTWLVAQAAEWLRLAGVGRLLAYAVPDEEDDLAFLESVGFRELTCTARGWERREGGQIPQGSDPVVDARATLTAGTDAQRLSPAISRSCVAFLESVAFRELTRAARGWERREGGQIPQGSVPAVGARAATGGRFAQCGSMSRRTGPNAEKVLELPDGDQVELAARIRTVLGTPATT